MGLTIVRSLIGIGCLIASAFCAEYVRLGTDEKKVHDAQWGTMSFALMAGVLFMVAVGGV